jgi:hypothetical protein
MVERRDRHERMFAEAKKKGRTPAEDPRKAKYAKLVKRTNDKYRRTPRSGGILCEKADPRTCEGVDVFWPRSHTFHSIGCQCSVR